MRTLLLSSFAVCLAATSAAVVADPDGDGLSVGNNDRDEFARKTGMPTDDDKDCEVEEEDG